MSQQKKQKNKQAAKSAVSIQFTKNGWEDYSYWKKSDATVLALLERLLTECLRNPFEGTGKPEPLKGDLTGYWSRRITKEHRLVYAFEGGCLIIIACRHHY